MREAFVKTLTKLAKRDPRITLITGDLGFGILTEFAKSFPKQFINAGVAEQNMTGLATGLALEGKIVFTYSIANFSTLRCLEQIRNDAAYHAANVKVVAVGAGFSYGALGFSHHATEDLAVMRSIPGISIGSPCDLWEAEAITEKIAYHSGTCFLRLDKSHAESTNLPGAVFEFGKIRRIREGKDCTLVATGGILRCAINAAAELEKQNIQCRVLSVHTLIPLDTTELEQAAAETKGMITIEEHTVNGGLGGLIAETLLENNVRPRFFYRMGLRNTFSTTVGSQEYLRKVYSLDAPSIIERVRLELKSATGIS